MTMAATDESKGGEPTANQPEVRIFGDFRLIEKLGEGGMGAVYKAHQISMDRIVALKILAQHLSANPDFVKRFRREAQMSARLDHLNVIRGITVGEDKGVYYFAMEFVDGENLTEVLARLGRIAVADAVKITLDVARALEQAATRGLVHRDVKPANIMLTRDKIVKLADLGLAKATTDESELTATGVFFGTPPYMAPEQFKSPRDVDARSDIYSLGATLYHLVTGQKPFRGSVYEVLEQKERGSYQPASALDREVPAALDRIIAKAMQPRPEDRYQNATELIADLEASDLASRNLLLSKTEAGTVVTSSPTRQTTETSLEKSKPRSRASLIAAIVMTIVAAAALYPQARRFWAPAPGPGPSPTLAVPQGVARILTRAYGELAVGQLEEARQTLRRGLERYPTAAALENPLAELERGALVLFQYQTPDETLPLAPIGAEGDLTLTKQDNYRFAIVTTQPCFLYAFNVDERPSVSRLFPNEQFSPLANPVGEGKVHFIPAGGSADGGSWMHLDDFKGTERIFFVGLTRPLRDADGFGERLLADARGTLAAIGKTPGDFVGAGAASVAACSGAGPVQEFRFRHR